MKILSWLAFCLILLSGQSISAADHDKLLSELELYGSAKACAYKTNIPKADFVDAELLLLQKWEKTYKPEEEKLESEIFQRMLDGGMRVDKEENSLCGEVIHNFLALLSGYGIVSPAWEKVAAHYNQKNGQTASKSSSSTRLEPGAYEVKAGEGEDMLIFFLPSGNGEYRVLDDDTPFLWIQGAGKLSLNFLTNGALDKEYKAGCKILSPTSFSCNNRTYVRSDEVRVAEYRYKEPGYSGSLYIYDFGSDSATATITTVREDSDATCELKLGCSEKNGSLICRDPESEDSDAMLIIKENAREALLDSTLPIGEYCGNGGNFTGVYKVYE